MKVKDLKKLLRRARSNLQAIDFIGYALIKFYNKKYFNELLTCAINADTKDFKNTVKTLLNYFYLVENLELIKPLKKALKDSL